MRKLLLCAAALACSTLGACAAQDPGPTPTVMSPPAPPVPPAAPAKFSQASLVIPADWKPIDQPDLGQQLDQAPKLALENLGTAVYGVDDPNDAGSNLVPNPDGKTYDVLLWYRKAYMQNTRVYIADLATGQVNLQTFDGEQGKVRVEQGFTWWGVLGFDGRLYGANTNWPQFSKGGVVEVYAYDPAQNKVIPYKSFKGYGGESTPLVLCPNGWIYGGATWAGPEDTHHKAAAYGFNPATGETRDFGPVGPKINGTGYAPSIGACDTHLYVACGKIPWSLVAIDLKTGEQKVLLTAPEGGDLMYVNGSQRRYFGGAVAWTQQGNDAPKQFYYLYHGQAIPKKGKTMEEGWALDDACPWPKETQAKSPTLAAAPAPDIHKGDLYPDNDGHANLWWRNPQPPTAKSDATGSSSASASTNKSGSAAASNQPSPTASPSPRNPIPETRNPTSTWQKIALNDVQVYPLNLHRFSNLLDGRLFGTGDGYKGRFIFDPKTDKVTPLGRGGGSLYCLAALGDKLYWSGYDCGRIFEFDPSRPWTLEKGGPPGQNRISSTDAAAFGNAVNPRRVHQEPEVIFHLTRVKKMLAAVVAADGRLYFGGKGQRDYEGGGLSWYDPKSREYGGFWKSFERRDIGWLTTAHNGRYVLIGCDGSKVSIFDTQTHQLLEDQAFEPVPGATKSGLMWEIAPGRIFGVVHDPANDRAAILYAAEISEQPNPAAAPTPLPSREGQGRVDATDTKSAGQPASKAAAPPAKVPTVKVLWRKPIPYCVNFQFAQGTDRMDFQKGPDGFIWATLFNGTRNVLARIDPRNANVEVLGELSPAGTIAFIGRDLYLTGTDQIRRAKNIVPE